MPRTTHFAAALAASLLSASAAHAETTLCTPIVPPIVISSPGSYCLLADYALKLTGSSAAIEVTANNVIIDFNGHRIGNMAAGSSNYGAGVMVQMPIQNLTLRNGTLRGFHTGISMGGPGMGHLVEDMLIDQSLYGGMYIFADNTTVRRNRVLASGTWGDQGVLGIHVAGSNNRVIDNDVTNTTSTVWNFIVGIDVEGDRFIVSGNRVTGLFAPASAIEYGIRASGTGTIANNFVLDNELPAGGSGFGIAAMSSPAVKIVGNNVTVPGTPYSGGNQIIGTNN
jgi:hypothetical protein